jgi:hypothetical protein|tara:strand:+ start:2321 stop:2467 length:147 start_codon:yes stop_codon:yes gene_type:complete
MPSKMGYPGIQKNPIKSVDGTKIKKITRKAKGGGAAKKGLKFVEYGRT